MGSIMDQERPWDRKDKDTPKDTSEETARTRGIFPPLPPPTRRFDLEALRKRLGLIPK